MANNTYEYTLTIYGAIIVHANTEVEARGFAEEAYEAGNYVLDNHDLEFNWVKGCVTNG